MFLYREKIFYNSGNLQLPWVTLCRLGQLRNFNIRGQNTPLLSDSRTNDLYCQLSQNQFANIVLCVVWDSDMLFRLSMTPHFVPPTVSDEIPSQLFGTFSQLFAFHEARRGKGTNLLLWKLAYENARRLTSLKYPNRVIITYPSP